MNGGIVEMCASEFQIIKDAVTRRREVDEQTLSAAAILQDRLERVRSLGGKFGSVGFSSDMKKLLRHRGLVTVG
ncbi:MAG: hypothetical protein WCZ89_06825 [Phycisphaerae bacterium]